MAIQVRQPDECDKDRIGDVIYRQAELREVSMVRLIPRSCTPVKHVTLRSLYLQRLVLCSVTSVVAVAETTDVVTTSQRSRLGARRRQDTDLFSL